MGSFHASKLPNQGYIRTVQQNVAKEFQNIGICATRKQDTDHHSGRSALDPGPHTCTAAVKLCCENLVAGAKLKALDQKYKEKYSGVFGAPDSSKLKPEVTHHIKLIFHTMEVSPGVGQAGYIHLKPC